MDNLKKGLQKLKWMVVTAAVSPIDPFCENLPKYADNIFPIGVTAMEHRSMLYSQLFRRRYSTHNYLWCVSS